MLRVLGICRPVNGFLKVGDMISLLRRFPRFCRPSVFFFRAYRTVPHTLGNPAAHGSFVCNRRCSCGRSRYMLYGCGKNAHSFFFLRQSRHCIDLFLYFLLAVLPECCFSVPLWNLTTASPSSYPIRTVIQFSRYTGKISPIYRQREGPFVDPLLEKFFKVRKSPQFWQIQRRKFALYLFSHPSACRSHCLCEQIFL